MKVKRNLFISIVFALVLINLFYYVPPLFKNTNEPLTNKIATHIVSSDDLIHSFKIDEEKSTKIYEGKVIEVTGFVKDISFLNDKTTLILKSEADSFGIICELNPTEKENMKYVEKNKKIRVKGICKGYLKDVILLNCSIELPTNE